MTDARKDQKALTEKEIAKRRDEGLQALLKMPPKPHKELVGKRRKKPTGKRKPAK